MSDTVENDRNSAAVLLPQARKALAARDGRQALELVNQILEEEESCVDAWLIAMKSFQLILPVDAYQSANELGCAEAAIHYAPKTRKYRVRKEVYLFLMTKILDVLRQDEKVLKDARGLLDWYQRVKYFDAAGAPKKLIEHDKPVRDAVKASYVYCQELFEFIPDSFLKRNKECNVKASEVAAQWARTWGYMEMRYELYGRHLTEDYVREGLTQYARFLRAVRNREEILTKEVTFNIYHMDQMPFLQ